MVECQADGHGAGTSCGSACGIHDVFCSRQREMIGRGDTVARSRDVIAAACGCRARIITVENDPFPSQWIIEFGVERELAAADAARYQIQGERSGCPGILPGYAPFADCVNADIRQIACIDRCDRCPRGELSFCNRHPYGYRFFGWEAVVAHTIAASLREQHPAQ